MNFVSVYSLSLNLKMLLKWESLKYIEFNFELFIWQTPLFLAVLKDNFEVVKCLLTYNADPNIQGKVGNISWFCYWLIRFSQNEHTQNCQIILDKLFLVFLLVTIYSLKMYKLNLIIKIKFCQAIHCHNYIFVPHQF